MQGCWAVPILLSTWPLAQTPADPDAALREQLRTYARKNPRHAPRLTNFAVRQSPSGSWVPDLNSPLPIDWAEFVCHAMAAAAANVGGVNEVLAGRPGSWEADMIRQALTATVGADEHDLWRHRTEPVDVNPQ